MTTVLLDSHVVHWWSAEPERLSRRAARVISAADELAVSLPASFPSDPADRLIYASAIELGCQLVTKDQRIREHPHPRSITVW